MYNSIMKLQRWRKCRRKSEYPSLQNCGKNSMAISCQSDSILHIAHRYISRIQHSRNSSTDVRWAHSTGWCRANLCVSIFCSCFQLSGSVTVKGRHHTASFYFSTVCNTCNGRSLPITYWSNENMFLLSQCRGLLTNIQSKVEVVDAFMLSA